MDADFREATGFIIAQGNPYLTAAELVARATKAAREEAAAELARLTAENGRLRLFLGEIAAMGPADEEWDANTLEDAVALAKTALANGQSAGDA